MVMFVIFIFGTRIFQNIRILVDLSRGYGGPHIEDYRNALQQAASKIAYGNEKHSQFGSMSYQIKTPVFLERKEVAPYPKGYLIFLFVNSTLQLTRCAFFKDNP